MALDKVTYLGTKIQKVTDKPSKPTVEGILGWTLKQGSGPVLSDW